VVCVGKGAIEGENFSLAKSYAQKINAAFAGSRPMADQHWIDFEAQIGESGTVIRPEACLICGVSGAIQFTEGIKGDPLVIAINKDPKAPIFGFADYKVVADMKDILPELLAAID
jgi:electron transfer flavoprotein alpha subunit